MELATMKAMILEKHTTKNGATVVVREIQRDKITQHQACECLRNKYTTTMSIQL